MQGRGTADEPQTGERQRPTVIAAAIHRMLCETTAAIGTAGEVIAGHLDAYHAGCRDGDQTAIRAA